VHFIVTQRGGERCCQRWLRASARGYCARYFGYFLGVASSRVGMDDARGSLALMSNELMIRGGGPEAWHHLDLADGAKSKPVLLPLFASSFCLFCLPPPRLIRVSYSSCFKALRSCSRLPPGRIAGRLTLKYD